MSFLFAKINHLWRWLGTAFSFFIFGLGGILLPLIAVPILFLIPGSSLQREQRAQQVIHRSFRFYIGMMKSLGVISYQLEGVERLRSAQLILANHPSLIDVIFLIALVPNANCVVKGRLVRNPFTRGPIKTAGYIINDNSNDVISAASDAFVKGHALIIFPEGTRTTPGQSVSLKRGAANVAIRAEADITPVIIGCTPTTLTKQDRWYQVPSRKVHFHIRVDEKMPVSEYLEQCAPSVGARKLTADLTEYFNKELGLYEQSTAGN